MTWQTFIPADIQDRYEIYDFHHAAAILSTEFPEEFRELCDALRKFKMTIAQIKKAGGNESDMPKMFRTILKPLGWKEDNLTASFTIDDRIIRSDTHKIDFLKSRVAFDFEWNSKDQTFDRDLYAFSTFFEYDKVSVGVIVTRGADLNPLFRVLGETGKFGASTTHIDKLLPRLRAGRNRGCPVLVFGIKRAVVVDAPEVVTDGVSHIRKKKKGKK